MPSNAELRIREQQRHNDLLEEQLHLRYAEEERKRRVAQEQVTPAQALQLARRNEFKEWFPKADASRKAVHGLIIVLRIVAMVAFMTFTFSFPSLLLLLGPTALMTTLLVLRHRKGTPVNNFDRFLLLGAGGLVLSVFVGIPLVLANEGSFTHLLISLVAPLSVSPLFNNRWMDKLAKDRGTGESYKKMWPYEYPTYPGVLPDGYRQPTEATKGSPSNWTYKAEPIFNNGIRLD